MRLPQRIPVHHNVEHWSQEPRVRRGRLARALPGAAPRSGAWSATPGGTELSAKGLELHEGDVLDAGLHSGAGGGADVAYYLVHGIGRGSNGDFTQRDGAPPRATSPGWPRRRASSGDLPRRPRRDPSSSTCAAAMTTSRILGAEGRRSPTSAPRWWSAAERVLPDPALPRRAPAGDDRAQLAGDRHPADRGGRRRRVPAPAAGFEAAGREVQIGGPDVLSYADMLDGWPWRSASGAARLPVPVLSPWLPRCGSGSSRRSTPASRGRWWRASTVETMVTDPSGAELFDVAHRVDEALRRAGRGLWSAGPHPLAATGCGVGGNALRRVGHPS